MYDSCLPCLKIEHRSADSSRSIPGHKIFHFKHFIYIWKMYSFEGSPFMGMFSHFIFRFFGPNLNTDFWWNTISYWLSIRPAGAHILKHNNGGSRISQRGQPWRWGLGRISLLLWSTAWKGKKIDRRRWGWMGVRHWINILFVPI